MLPEKYKLDQANIGLRDLKEMLELHPRNISRLDHICSKYLNLLLIISSLKIISLKNIYNNNYNFKLRESDDNIPKCKEISIWPHKSHFFFFSFHSFDCLDP